MKKIFNKISIVLVCYNSSFKLKKFIQKIPNKTKIYIIDNSKDYSLKKMFRSKKNVKIYYKKNDGYGSSINFAVKKIKTPYFLVAQPDVTGIKKSSLIKFYKYAKELKDEFSVIGPHFLNAPKSGHFQTSLKYKIKEIHNVHGSTMFFNKKIFNKNKGFDKNIFLYWEETDYSKRASKNGYKIFILYLIQRDDCNFFKIAKDIDSEYSNSLAKAVKTKLNILCYDCKFSSKGIKLNKKIKFKI